MKKKLTKIKKAGSGAAVDNTARKPIVEPKYMPDQLYQTPDYGALGKTYDFFRKAGAAAGKSPSMEVLDKMSYLIPFLGEEKAAKAAMEMTDMGLGTKMGNNTYYSLDGAPPTEEMIKASQSVGYKKSPMNLKNLPGYVDKDKNLFNNLRNTDQYPAMLNNTRLQETLVNTPQEPLTEQFKLGALDNIRKNKDGGKTMKVKVKAVPKAEDGLNVMWGGNYKHVGKNPYTGDTIKFDGNSHNKQDSQGRTGIGINYFGSPVEVEGDETAFVSKMGNGGEKDSLVVLGNMYIPGTNIKFKTYGNQLGKEESTINDELVNIGKLMNKGVEKIDANDPKNSYQLLGFNTGRAKVSAATIKGKEQNEALAQIAQEKEAAAQLQNQMHELAGYKGVSNNKLSKDLSKAKFGKSIKKYADGGVDDGSFSVNEFGIPSYYKNNITPPYSPTMELQDYTNIGRKNYGPITVPEGYDRSTKPSFRVPLNFDLSQENIPTETPMGNSDYNRFVGPPEGYDRPGNTQVPPKSPGTINQYKGSLADYNKLKLSQVAPDIAGLFEQPQPVRSGPQFMPQQYTPYQISLQDQVNQNNATFRTLSKQYANNPALVSHLANQTMQANDKVLGEQTKINQGRYTDVLDKNVDINNKTQEYNLGRLDTKLTRQDAAEAYTNRNKRDHLTHLADTITEHDKENMGLRMREQLLGYSWNPKLNDGKGGYEYIGGNQVPTIGGNPMMSGLEVSSKKVKSGDTTTNYRKIEDAYGNITYVAQAKYGGLIRKMNKKKINNK